MCGRRQRLLHATQRTSDDLHDKDLKQAAMVPINVKSFFAVRMAGRGLQEDLPDNLRHLHNSLFQEWPGYKACSTCRFCHAHISCVTSVVTSCNRT